MKPDQETFFFFFFLGVDKWGYLDLEYVIIFVYAILHPTYTKFIMGRNPLGVGPNSQSAP